ncbi:MAG: GntR family transcriptional regulator [Actinomycetes bacterium]
MADVRADALLVPESGQRQTAHGFVLDSLKRAILSGALPGGTRLIQSELAAQLKVSTTPVREALRDLVAVGLVRFDPHRGAVVKELDFGELTEIYELRRLLEPFSIRKVAQNITAEEIAAASELQDRMDETEESGAWVQLNWEFHSLLENAARAPRLQQMVKLMQNLAAIYVAHSITLDPERIAEGNHDHRALLEALERRDADDAAEILTRHLDGTLAAILATQRLYGDD